MPKCDKTRGTAEASFLRKLQNQRGHLQNDPFDVLKLVCCKSGGLAPFLRREGVDGSAERVSANIYQHAAVCKHFGVGNLRAVVERDKGITP